MFAELWQLAPEWLRVVSGGGFSPSGAGHPKGLCHTMEKIDYAEVAKHNTPGDAWVVVENQVRPSCQSARSLSALSRSAERECTS